MLEDTCGKVSMMGETAQKAPVRFNPQHPGYLIGVLIFVGFFLWSCSGAELSLLEIFRGIPHMGRLIGEMTPPDMARLPSVSRAVLVTFQMALVGSVVGIVLSFVLAPFAARTLSPHPVVYQLARLLISFCRSVPDLVWAIFFVATVGLGAFAGTLTIIVDTIGFCGRFFAESMEEVDKGPQEALSSLGANQFSIIACAVVPSAMPSFTTASLFSLEKAVRSSVVLGLVGAGGIGIELKVAMDLFQYQQAATIIIAVFMLVIGVEKLSSFIRNRLIM
jgi:phosphonate transport system permease protein